MILLLNFWKCWKSKFECTNRPVSYVNGVSDAETIAENVAAYFANTCTSNTITGANRLKMNIDVYGGIIISSHSTIDETLMLN